MHFLEIDDRGHAIMAHDGVQHELDISGWTHPLLVAGHPELGVDETLLVSPELEDENGVHTVFVPVNGDPAAQELHVAHRRHVGGKRPLAAIDEVRGHIDRLGGQWHLSDEGVRHAVPVLPVDVASLAEASVEPEIAPHMTRQQFLDLAMEISRQLPDDAPAQEDVDADSTDVR